MEGGALKIDTWQLRHLFCRFVPSKTHVDSAGGILFYVPRICTGKILSNNSEVLVYLGIGYLGPMPKNKLHNVRRVRGIKEICLDLT